MTLKTSSIGGFFRAMAPSPGKSRLVAGSWWKFHGSCGSCGLATGAAFRKESHSPLLVGKGGAHSKGRPTEPPFSAPPFATFAHGHKKLAKTRGVGGDELLEVNGQSSYEALKELRRWHKVGGARSFFRENTNFVAENGRGDILFRHPVGH